MIKIVIFFSRIIVVAICATLITSCNGNFGTGTKGSGVVKTEVRTITEKFTKIDGSNGIEIVVEQSPQVAISVEADDNLLKYIITKVENGTLIVKIDKNNVFASKLKVSIKMPIIESLITDSGCELRSQNTLKGTNLITSSDSGSNISLSLEYENVNAHSDSGSKTVLTGKALKLETSSDSGSELIANGLQANEIKATADSGSVTKLYPIVNLNAHADSGGEIIFYNNPKSIQKTEDSGGSVSAN